MKLISRYLIKELSAMSFYAMLALLALYSFFDVVNEIGDLGSGNYGGAEMLQYIALQIPAHAYELMPLAVLIGGLLALSRLASASELTVIKSSGTGTGRLIGILLVFGALFAVCTVALGEWVSPQAVRYAENMKTLAKTGRVSSGADGLWLKERGSFVNIREMLPDQTLRDIRAYRYSEDFKLAENWQAEAAEIRADGTWLLKNVRRSVLSENGVQTVHEAESLWNGNIKRGLLDVLLVKPDQMSLTALTAYIAHLHENNQETADYRISWWRKLMYPVATMVMALVAFAFTPQSVRHGNMGLRLFGGICLGLAFHFAGRLSGFTGKLYGLLPMFAAALPTLIFALWAVWLIYRAERR